LSTRPRVLIADDHVEVANSVGRLLALDCEVVGRVTDGSALLEAAQRLRPDVVVLDLNLPNVHGLTACVQITQLRTGIRVVVFTAMDDPEVRRRCFELGASAFVSKLATDDLLAAIKRLCVDPG
jgi:CheY-like chemotaxis protein